MVFRALFEKKTAVCNTGTKDISDMGEVPSALVYIFSPFVAQWINDNKPTWYINFFSKVL